MYDTFGASAAEASRREAQEAQARSRHAGTSGLVPQELVAPVADGAGVRLLQRMGWRQGRGVGFDPGAGAEEGTGPAGGSRWGRVAGTGTEATPLYLLEPKQDLHGIGYDPFKVLPTCMPGTPAWVS